MQYIATLALMLVFVSNWSVNAEEISEELVLSIGDRDYGEYLSSECTACHQLSGEENGIPSITNWPLDSFAISLLSYKNGDREHPIMGMIAKRLSKEEIASLAIFFNSLNN